MQGEPGGAALRRTSGTPTPRSGFAHGAAEVASSAEAVAVAAAFVEEGLRQGDLPVLGCPPESAEAVRRALGTRVGPVEDDARICLVGVRAPDAFVVVRRLLERARGTGSGRLRILAEPQWGADRRRWREVQRYESAANALMTGTPVTAMCLYDRERLPAEVLAGARQTHPELVADGVRAASPDFRRPERYLRDLGVAREPVEAGEPVFAVDAAPTLPALRGALRQVLAEEVPDEDQCADLHLAVSEVAANAFRHGRQPVSARVWADGDALVCAISDSGHTFDDPLAGFLPAHGDDLGAGGMGLWLARKLWDSVDLLAGEHGLTVRLSTTLVTPRSWAGVA
ncbi:anti-sigma regulatory factor (Ser/Thr protein kinase) [Geodermatophilus bullaregiensis]|uniref:sensor histidine kinase n=1 Tax=Geodermatophilus bullaregiensis TaxID=1564160 RepID=UPI001956AE67|nr:sensor histidine kinase [Geodermatophilus bullaregiensis]MBM7806716.1 anti-sigma regulatory factor (Ser/Thr protein kinase) [Geodermatophilus bullaregiensis]